MSETICAVIIGGLIGILGSIPAWILEFKKWKSNQKIQRLRNKRERLESMYNEAKEKLTEGMSQNSYDSELFADFEISFPENVRNLFLEMIRDKEKHTDLNKMKVHRAKILFAMKNSLKEIDDKIDDEIGVK